MNRSDIPRVICTLTPPQDGLGTKSPNRSPIFGRKRSKSPLSRRSISDVLKTIVSTGRRSSSPNPCHSSRPSSPVQSRRPSTQSNHIQHHVAHQIAHQVHQAATTSNAFLQVPLPAGVFRARSKSLDDSSRPKRLPHHPHLRPSDVSDCETTYRIYDQILKEGVIRRSSLDKRRLSLGTVAGGGHRGSDPALDPNHAAILFRDSRGLPVADPFLEKVNLSDLEEDESQIFVKFFRFHKCYDLIPTSAKLVVFDTQLLVKKAFFALVYNGVRAAPLWDSIQHKFVGMLTITDFIKILKMYYGKTNGPEWMHEFESHKLDTWRKVLKDEVRELVSIGPDASLYEAISILVQHRIHRLPVVDQETNNVLYILTHKRILRFLFLYINDLPRPSFMSKTLAELRVGTFQDVATAKQETTIISALDVFMDRRVSALPIVDEDNKLVDIYAKFDVINLAAEKTYDNLDVSLKEANDHRNEWFEGVHKCSMDDTLYTIIERIVRAEVHRLVVTDDEERVIGVVSLSDILDYLVLKPAREDLACRSESPSMSESLAYSNTQEDTIAEGEEEEERERSPTQTWTQPQWSVTPAAPLTSA